ncbi:MAG: glycosyltransferase [Oceanospirillaceae bacterium]|nr:glycosyltransferase [Oceanospirillaceae bacterium]
MKPMKKKPTVLHLTHNDIKNDARTLKQIFTAEEHGFEVYGLGVRLQKGLRESKLNIDAEIESLNLFFQRLRLPKVLKHLTIMLELSARMLIKGPRLKPDIIHCSDTLVLPIGALLKLLCSAKLVYDAHELESQKNGSTRITSAATFFIERVLWRWVDALVVVSPSINDWYMENIGEKFSRVVLNSPIFDRSRPLNRNYLREKFNISENHCIFLYIGILGEGRGIREILDTFSEGDVNASVVFLGYGPLEVDIRGASCFGSKIFIHEGVENEKVVSISSSADVGICLLQAVSLSDYYSLPNKIFEYVFAGLPVITTDFPDLRDFVVRYDLGVCIDFSKESFRNAVKNFIADQGHTPNDKSFLEEVSWARQGIKLIECYEHVLKL